MVLHVGAIVELGGAAPILSNAVAVLPSAGLVDVLVPVLVVVAGHSPSIPDF